MLAKCTQYSITDRRRPRHVAHSFTNNQTRLTPEARPVVAEDGIGGASPNARSSSYDRKSAIPTNARGQTSPPFTSPPEQPSHGEGRRYGNSANPDQPSSANPERRPPQDERRYFDQRDVLPSVTGRQTTVSRGSDVQGRESKNTRPLTNDPATKLVSQSSTGLAAPNIMDRGSNAYLSPSSGAPPRTGGMTSHPNIASPPPNFMPLNPNASSSAPSSGSSKPHYSTSGPGGSTRLSPTPSDDTYNFPPNSSSSFFGTNPNNSYNPAPPDLSVSGRSEVSSSPTQASLSGSTAVEFSASAPHLVPLAQTVPEIGTDSAVPVGNNNRVGGRASDTATASPPRISNSRNIPSFPQSREGGQPDEFVERSISPSSDSSDDSDDLEPLTPSTPVTVQEFKEHTTGFISDKGLGSFYSPEDPHLLHLVRQAAEKQEEIMDKYKLAPKEASNIIKLALYNFVVLCGKRTTIHCALAFAVVS
jgi:hypothetical protein